MSVKYFLMHKKSIKTNLDQLRFNLLCDGRVRPAGQAASAIESYLGINKTLLVKYALDEYISL